MEETNSMSNKDINSERADLNQQHKSQQDKPKSSENVAEESDSATDLSSFQEAIDKIEELSESLSAMNDRYMRLNADWENYRKRSEKEKVDARRFALEDFFQALIPVLDSFEQALPDKSNETANDLESSLRKGMVLVKKLLMDTTQRFGLESFGCVGDVFDPNLHQALQKVEKEEIEEELVDVVYRKGYQLHRRLTRAAEVVVAIPKSAG